MADSYQAIYDAVRSRISNGDVGRAVSDAAFRQFDISHIVARLHQDFSIAAQEMARPSAIYRPELTADGTKWIALYGPDLQFGVSGHGDTPNEAMADFDQQWWKANTPAATRQIRAIEEEDARREREDNGQFGVGA